MPHPELLLNVILSRQSNLRLTYYSFVAGDGNAMGDVSTSTGRRRRPSRIFFLRHHGPMFAVSVLQFADSHDGQGARQEYRQDFS